MRLRLPNTNAPVLRLWGEWAVLLIRVLRERVLWGVLLGGALALSLAYQSPRSLLADIGGTLEGVRTPGFYGPERASDADKTTLRWSRGDSALELRGLGRLSAPFNLTLQLSSGRPSGSSPVQVALSVNGRPQQPITLTRDSKPYVITVDPAWVDLSGDVRLDFSSPTFEKDGDSRGFTADFVRVDLPGRITLPSLTQVWWLLLSAFLLYLLARSTWLTPRGAGLIVALFLLGCAGVIAIHRLLLTTFTTRLAAALAVALLAALVAETLTRWLTRWAGWRGESALPEWAWAGLRGLLAFSVALKLAGVIYPSAFIIDAPFHLKRVTYMAEGRPWDQYFGESLALSVMPENEWGSARSFIPYSPFFYVIAAPLAKLPVPLSLSVPAISAALEGLKVALIFLIALSLSRAFRRTRPTTEVTSASATTQYAIRNTSPTPNDARIALAGAAFYALIPAMFMLQQWGNWPTQLSLWLLTLWAAFVCLFWPRIARPLPFVTMTLLLALTMVSYTVTAVYVGLLAGMIAVAGWLFVREERKRWLALALSLVGASALALLLYYGQYVGKIFDETLPTLGGAIQSQGSLTTLRPTVWDFLTGHIAKAMQSYHLALIYALGLAGTLWLFLSRKGSPSQSSSNYGIVSQDVQTTRGTARRAPTPNASTTVRERAMPAPARWQRIWLGAWLLTFPLFTLADFWVDQALKQFWIALPAVSVVAGGWLVALSLRGRTSRWAGALVSLLAVTLAWQSLSLWVFRLLFHNQ